MKIRKMDVHFTNRWRWRQVGMISFHLLPAVEFSVDNLDNELSGDNFMIAVMWLFWCLAFTFYVDRRDARGR